MGDTMGLMGMGGAAGAGDAIAQLFQQRMQAAQLQQQQQAEQDRMQLGQATLAQNDALKRLAIKEHADTLAAAEKDRKANRARLMLSLRPIGATVTPEEMAAETEAGAPSGLYEQKPAEAAIEPNQPVGPMQTGGLMPIDPGRPAQPARIAFAGTQQQQQAADELQQKADLAEAARVDRLDRQREAERARADLAKLTASLKPTPDKLTKVEHKDPKTGRTVIEWLPQSEVKGKTFEKGASAATESRLASAQAVTQTGDDIIQQMSDPNVAATLGPALGRYTTLQEFIGSPPPEFSELAGQIESYALANMGVHGMRSAQGAEKIKALLSAKHTPESLAAAIRGLNKFSDHFMQNEGRAPAAPGGQSGGKVLKYNPATGKVE